MSHASGFVPPPIPQDEEHIIRRLGWALVKLWPDIPEETRQQIREQAVFTWDRDETVQLNEQINIFLGEYGGGTKYPRGLSDA